MEIFDYFLAFSLLLGISRSSTDGICQNINFAINKNVVPDHALEGHVFKNLTVDKVAQCHLMCREDCRCISMHYVHNKERNNCELNDLNKEMDQQHWNTKLEQVIMIWRDSIKLTKVFSILQNLLSKVKFPYETTQKNPLRPKMLKSISAFIIFQQNGRNFVQGRVCCVNKCCQSNQIHVSREGPVRRFVTPPLWGSTVLTLLITLVAGARKIFGAAKIWQQMAPKYLECTSCRILK